MRYLITLLFALFVSASGAIEPPKEDKPPATTAPPTAPAPEPSTETTPPAGTEPADAAAEDAEEEKLPPLPEGTPTGPSPTRFNPSEKVRADFPVSFPIDI